MKIFFYGLFMDESVLAAQGIRASGVKTGFVDGYSLRIGERATLVPDRDSRAYGIVMDVIPGDVETLYAGAGLADYMPEPLTVNLRDGTQVEATCFNLPIGKVTGVDKDYAKALLKIATRLGFPDPYLDEIRKAQA